MIFCDFYVFILCVIFDFLDKMNSFIDIELFPALNEHKCTRFRESKQGVDDHIHIGGVFFRYFSNFAVLKVGHHKIVT